MAPIRCCFDQTAVWHSDAARGPSTPSFDHLVGGGEQRLRHVEAEHPSRRNVDDELELRRLHDRQIRWLCALENAACVDADVAIRIYQACAVAHQSADFGMMTVLVYCGNRVAG